MDANDANTHQNIQINGWLLSRLSVMVRAKLKASVVFKTRALDLAHCYHLGSAHRLPARARRMHQRAAATLAVALMQKALVHPNVSGFVCVFFLTGRGKRGHFAHVSAAASVFLCSAKVCL